MVRLMLSICFRRLLCLLIRFLHYLLMDITSQHASIEKLGGSIDDKMKYIVLHNIEKVGNKVIAQCVTV